MNKGQVILVSNPHPSHSWQNGLYVITRVLKKSKELQVAKLQNDGTIKSGLLDSIIGCNNNPNIILTKLTYKL